MAPSRPQVGAAPIGQNAEQAAPTKGLAPLAPKGLGPGLGGGRGGFGAGGLGALGPPVNALSSVQPPAAADKAKADEATDARKRVAEAVARAEQRVDALSGGEQVQVIQLKILC